MASWQIGGEDFRAGRAGPGRAQWKESGTVSRRGETIGGEVV